MNALARFFRDALERLAGSFYEGPKPPPRLRDQVLLFRLTQPAATVLDWCDFAVGMVEAAYRDGFVRGLEWRERDLADKPTDDDLRAADEVMNSWRLADEGSPLRAALDSGVDPADPLNGMSPAARAEYADMIGRLYGTHRVVVVDDPEETEPAR